jgi:hypothetical protein
MFAFLSRFCSFAPFTAKKPKPVVLLQGHAQVYLLGGEQGDRHLREFPALQHEDDE